MTPEMAVRVVNDHVVNGNVVQEFTIGAHTKNKGKNVMYRSNVLVCGGTGCSSSNSQEIIQRLEEEIKKKGLEKEVNVVRTGCFGLCSLGPVVAVYPKVLFIVKSPLQIFRKLWKNIYLKEEL